MYDAVIFDNDGVLVEPPLGETMRKAVEEAFAACGLEDPTPEDADALYGGISLEVLKDVAARYGVGPHDLWAARDRAFINAQQADIEAGAVDVYDDIDAVRIMAVPAAVVSSNQQAHVDHVLERFGLAELFISAYGRRPGVPDVALKKPDPHFLRRAIADITAAAGARPQRVLMVGDSTSDVRAARNAGVDAAYLNRPHCDEPDGVEPDHVLAGLDELAALVAE